MWGPGSGGEWWHGFGDLTCLVGDWVQMDLNFHYVVEKRIIAWCAENSFF